MHRCRAELQGGTPRYYCDIYLKEMKRFDMLLREIYITVCLGLRRISQRQSVLFFSRPLKAQSSKYSFGRLVEEQYCKIVLLPTPEVGFMSLVLPFICYVLSTLSFCIYCTMKGLHIINADFMM